ncbi:uncharacterized protein LOC129780103 [Toxorhynchites rutilus septentrionalis]|uniref:uncharacterized protein LOC129780103 n=1 Tax=Toxorhynchites rutilus septentrionalis TaxID=329112 RepID=UPI0024783FA8|nr:uncharacterized protein LOC129780103 [Toxorhynchites rutilus septentrionalis]
MKFFLAIIALASIAVARASYIPTILDHQVSVPVSTSVWPANGLYAKTLLPTVAVNKYAYPAVYGSQWPVYGKNWGYSAPIVTKVVDNGLWNYGGHGYGLGYNKHWL